MRISDWSSDVCSSDLIVGELHPLAALEQGLGVVQYLRVEAVGHRVAEIRTHRAALIVGRVDLGEDRVEVEVVEMLGAAADLAQQLGAADHLVRSEERRVGKECVSTCRARWSPHL